MSDKKSIDHIENELKEYYGYIQNVEVPKDLEEKLLSNIQGIKPKKKKRKYKGLLAASIILACLITTLTFYPAIADTVLDLLRFKDSVPKHDDGVKKVFEGELGEEVYIQSSNPNKTIVLQRVYRDKNRIIFLATAHSNKNEKIDGKFFEGVLVDENGKSVSAFYKTREPDEGTDSALLRFQFDKDIEKLGQHLTLTIQESDIFERMENKEQNNNSTVEKEVDSDNSDVHTFSLDSLKANKGPVATIDINKEVNISDIKVNFKKIEATPSEMRIYYEFDTKKIYTSKSTGFEDLRFSIKKLIIDGKEYSKLYGKGEGILLCEDNTEWEQGSTKEAVKTRNIDFYAFNTIENLDDIKKIQDIKLEIEHIYKRIPMYQTIPLEKSDEAYYTGTDGKKYKISIDSFEIKDDNLVVECKLDERMNISFSGVSQGDNVYINLRQTRLSKPSDDTDIKNHIVSYRLVFEKPPKLTDLKLIIENAEVMLQDVNVELK